MDIVDKGTRSRMMSGIRGKNTKPEIALRSGLHRLGLRFTLDSKLPGRPDIVFPRYRTVVFFHGCFWHGHASCALFKLPKTRAEFWKKKILGNRTRDAQVCSALLAAGWRIAVVRECSIRGIHRTDISVVCRLIADWLKNGEGTVFEIVGKFT